MIAVWELVERLQQNLTRKKRDKKSKLKSYRWFCWFSLPFLNEQKYRQKYLLTTFMDAALPFTIPCAGPAGFRPLAATLGRVMRLGFAVTARLDLGPTEVLRGTTV